MIEETKLINGVNWKCRRLSLARRGVWLGSRPALQGEYLLDMSNHQQIRY